MDWHTHHCIFSCVPCLFCIADLVADNDNKKRPRTGANTLGIYCFISRGFPCSNGPKSTVSFATSSSPNGPTTVQPATAVYWTWITTGTFSVMSVPGSMDVSGSTIANPSSWWISTPLYWPFSTSWLSYCQFHRFGNSSKILTAP